MVNELIQAILQAYLTAHIKLPSMSWNIPGKGVVWANLHLVAPTALFVDSTNRQYFIEFSYLYDLGTRVLVKLDYPDRIDLTYRETPGIQHPNDKYGAEHFRFVELNGRSFEELCPNGYTI